MISQSQTRIEQSACSTFKSRRGHGRIVARPDRLNEIGRRKAVSFNENTHLEIRNFVLLTLSRVRITIIFYASPVIFLHKNLSRHPMQPRPTSIFQSFASSARKSIGLTTIVVSVCFIVGSTACQTPNERNSVPLAKVSKDLPSDWTTLKATDWRMAYLDPATRESLFLFRKELSDQAVNSDGSSAYSDATYRKLREMNEECNKSYCANAVVIGRDETPELAGTSESINEAYMNSTTVGDVNLRQVQDDWARFWLMNKPSTLSPYPIVNTGGRP